MTNPNIEALRALLEEVPYAALHSYFKANEIPLPKDGSKDKLVDLLLTQEYKKDVRAAIFVELKAVSSEFASDLKESAKELEELKADMKIKLAAIDGWKQLFQLAGFIFAALAAATAIFGTFKLSDLQRDAREAQQQLQAGSEIIVGYRRFILNSVSRSVSATMNLVSTRWFKDVDRASVADDLAVYRDNLEKLQEVPSAASDKTTLTETKLILKFLRLIEAIVVTTPDNPSTNEYAAAERKWQELHADWAALAKVEGPGRVQAQIYLAYTSNVLGVFYHTRYRAADRKTDSANARRYLDQAQKYFEEAVNLRGSYASAMSNLGVALLDNIEVRFKFPQAGDTPVQDSDFKRADDALLKAKDFKQLSPVTQARLLNNIGMSALLKSLVLASKGDANAALEQLTTADRYVDQARAIPGAPEVVLLSKAEISAFRAVQKQKIGQSPDTEFQSMRQWLTDTVAAKYKFEGGLQGTLEDSPSFTEFQKKFPTQSDDIWRIAFKPG